MGDLCLRVCKRKKLDPQKVGLECGSHFLTKGVRDRERKSDRERERKREERDIKIERRRKGQAAKQLDRERAKERD